MTFSAASKKHGIPTNQLFQWRKQFESISLRLVNGGATSESANCSRTLSEIDKLERLQNMTIGKLTEEIRRSQITSYNASIALSNLVNGLTKLDALRAQAQEKLEHLHPSNPARAMPFDEATLEEERMAKMLVIEMVRKEIEAEKQRKMRGTAGGANV